MNKSLILWSSAALLSLAACNDEAQEGIPLLSGKPAFAVQLSNFNDSAGVALIDGEGKLLEAKYLSSGSALPGLNAAIPSDIALPSTPCGEGDTLTLLARLMGDFVLQVNLDDSSVIDQFRTQTSTGDTAYSSNPQDLLCLGDGRAVVSRLGHNEGAAPTDLDRGDDLVVVDLAKGQLLSRIDLGAYQGQVTATDYDTNAEVVETTFASPGSIVAVGPKHAIVGLSRLSANFNANTVGQVALLDLDALTTKPFAIDGLANCGSVYRVPGRDDAAIVQCAGAYYGNPDNSGLALVSVTNGEAKVENVFKVALEGVSLSSSPTPLGGTRVIATTANFAKKPDGTRTADKAYVVDLKDGSYQELFTASTAGDIGSGSVRADTGLVLVPDLSAGIRVFELKDDQLTAKDSLPIDPVVPARNIRPLYAF
ncbi:MAG: hypothetical protein QM778_36670 [Myxococcales bacterium]